MTKDKEQAGKPKVLHVAPRHVLKPQSTASTNQASFQQPNNQTAGVSPQPLIAQTVSPTINFTAATFNDCSGWPPDTMGAVGPTQFIIALNGRVRSFDKTTGSKDGAIDVTTDIFFNSVMTPGSNFTTDPRIRYDRLCGRWFITMIDVPGQKGTLPNRVMMAMSDSSIITAGTVWTFFQFQQDQVGTAPNSDTGDFADYPTLGIDANALYVGVSIFNSSGTFVNTTAFVIQKSSLLSGGPIQVTAFRGLISGSGPFTVHGADNYDAAATEGYLIGVDASSTSQLDLLRVSNPGSSSVSLSASIPISVTTWGPPINVTVQGSSTAIDGLDDRLLAAHFRNGSLWTSHNVGVTGSGSVGSRRQSADRNGVQWFQLTGIPTGQTPAVVQSGIVYQNGSVGSQSFWMGTIMVSGQGHAALDFTTAGPTNYLDAATTGRLVGDSLGTMNTPVSYTASTSAYNPTDGSTPHRWGDYSFTSLDPDDDMTMWTIQEWCAFSGNGFGVQVAKLLAPPPAAPLSCSPDTVTQGVASVSVSITGSTANGAGFFDPGTGFSNRLALAINGGGVTVNSLTYNNPSNITAVLDIAANATTGSRPITVTNPDGQSATSASGLLTIAPGSSPPQLTLSPPAFAFGQVVISQTSTQTFQVVNTGNLSLTGSAATTSPFSISSGSPFTIAGGQTGLVQVSFSPTTASFSSNVVVFTSNGGNSTNTVTGSGVTPAQLAVAPVSLNFGIVAVGSSSQSSFVITNEGGAAITNGVAAVSGGPFSILSGTPFSLAGFGWTNLVIRFAPASAASFSNAVVLTSNGGDSSNSLTGVGAIPPVAAFSGSPTSGVAPLTVSFTDTSTGTITNRFWAFGDGATTNTTAVSLNHTYATASTNTVSLTVTGPVGTNTLTQANYIVATNLPPPELTVSPASLSFGTLVIGQTNTQRFQLVNSGGLNLTGSVTATLPFSINGGTPFNISPGQTGLVQVSFSPASAGSFSNGAVFVSNGGDSTNALTGSGETPPQLAIAPGGLDFGIVSVGSSSQASFVITNEGGAAITNGVATISGGPFTIVSGTPLTLPGFGSTNLVIQFAPTSAASFSNTVVVSSNGGDSTNSLTGVGAVWPVAGFTASPTSGIVPLAVSFTDTSTGTITNRFWAFGDGATTNTTAVNLNHTYVTASTNSVTLTVTGPVGTNTLIQANYIVATNLPPPRLTLSPASLSFGSLVIGQTNTQTFQLVNSGGLTLTGSVATTLPFTIGSGTPYNIAPGQTGLVQVSFSPTSSGNFSNTAVFLSNGGDSTNALTGSAATPPHLAIAPGGLDFGTVAVGSSLQASFVITNEGGGAITNGAATVSGGPFSILSGTPFILPGFGSTNLVVQFAPASAADFSNMVVITSNGGNSTNSLTGVGAIPPIAGFSGSPTTGLAPLTVSFTDTSAGTITNRFWVFGDGASTNTTAVSLNHTYVSAGTNTVTLTVTGPVGTNTFTQANYIVATNLPPPQLTLSPALLSFGTLVIGQTNTQSFQLVNSGGLTLIGSVSAILPFALSSGSPFNIAPGQTGLVQVTFSPTSAGSFSNAAVFASNGGDSTNALTGSGLTPPQLATTPASLDFGIVAVGSSLQASFVITNEGGAAITNGAATVSGGPFSILSGTPFTLPGFGSTNLVVQFAPPSAANFSNLVVLTSNGGNSTNSLMGVGAIPPVAGFSGSPISGLAPLTVTFTDTSTGTITNRFWAFGDGATTNTAAVNLNHTYATASTNSVTLTVTGPVRTNTLTQANYIVATNPPPPQLTLSPASLSFGSLVIGQTNTQTFQLVNSGGLTLTGSVATTSPFAISSGAAFDIAPGQTGLVQVTFNPTSAGSFSNAAVFISNGGDSTNALTGSAVTPPQLGIKPFSLDFGAVAVGSTSQASFVITNEGGAAITNGIATVGNGTFSILSGTPFTLAGFGSTNLVVQFAPASEANFSNVVVLSSNGGNSTNSLTGLGAIPPVASFTGSPTSGLAPLTVSFTDASTGTITNRLWSFGDGTSTNTAAVSLNHTYASAGTNTVTLTVSGALGTDGLAQAAFIEVTNLGPVTITIQLLNSQVQLLWSGGTLQSAPRPAGPFTNASGAISPYIIPLPAGTQFFRVQVN